MDGKSYLNESMLTGESKPVEKKKGEKVIAGSINGNAAIKVMVMHSAENSYLSQVIKLVRMRKMQNQIRNYWQTKLHGGLLIAIAAGVITFVFWLSAGKILHLQWSAW